jgi:hypothetical protein
MGNRSVTGGVGQFLLGKDIVVGLGARPVRAGSIGRGTFVHEEFNALPPKAERGEGERAHYIHRCSITFPELNKTEFKILDKYSEKEYFISEKPHFDR